MNRTEYKNQHIKEHYDRVNLVIPKGQKEALKSFCQKLNISVNEYIKLLIIDDTSSGKSKLLSKLNGFNEEQHKLLDKWQIPSKYRDMIQDFYYSKEDGYFVRLKEGYINDVTKSKIIHVDKMKEVRAIINKSRKCL